MEAKKINENIYLSETVEHRVGVGPSEIVSGWHELLRSLFQQMAPYLKAGKIIIFQNLTAQEMAFFEALSRATTVSDKVVGFYLPPSVRRQMMGEELLDNSEATDVGSVVTSHTDMQDIIVNALFALPPFTPRDPKPIRKLSTV